MEGTYCVRFNNEFEFRNNYKQYEKTSNCNGNGGAGGNSGAGAAAVCKDRHYGHGGVPHREEQSGDGGIQI